MNCCAWIKHSFDLLRKGKKSCWLQRWQYIKITQLSQTVWTHPSTFKNIYQSDLSVLQICKYLLASAADFQVFFVVVLFFCQEGFRPFHRLCLNFLKNFIKKMLKEKSDWSEVFTILSRAPAGALDLFPEACRHVYILLSCRYYQVIDFPRKFVL